MYSGGRYVRSDRWKGRGILEAKEKELEFSERGREWS